MLLNNISSKKLFEQHILQKALWSRYQQRHCGEKLCLSITYEDVFNMKSKFLVPTSEVYYDFTHLIHRIPGWTGLVHPKIKDIISRQEFWLPIGSSLSSTMDVLEEYPGILFIAEDLLVSKEQLENDITCQHEQHVYCYSDIWNLLLANKCVSLFDTHSLAPTIIENIFREVSGLMVELIEGHARQNNLNQDSEVSLEFKMWLSTCRNILVNLFYAKEMDAAVLWSPSVEEQVRWVIEWIGAKTPPDMPICSPSVLYYRSNLPDVPLIEHNYEKHTVLSYPQNIELVMQIRSERITKVLRSHLLSIHELMETEENVRRASNWADELSSISEELDSHFRRQVNVSTLVGALGIGLGAAGIFNILAGITGLGIAVFSPLANWLLAQPIRRIKDKHPQYAEAFRLQRIYTRRFRDHEKHNARSMHRTYHYERPDFLEMLRSNTVRQDPTKLCMAITKLGRMCKRRALEGDFFCSRHRLGR